MTLALDPSERSLLAGEDGDAAALAMRVVVAAAELVGAERLVPVVSAHVDGCLHHGDGGVEFAERLVAGGGRVAVPTTLNVGALDLLHPGRVRGDPARLDMARRQMRAYQELGCAPTWTCAPYQAGHRPAAGDQVAWGESNAIAFVNSVLGARTERYGDFLDACCAITGRVPLHGLHTDAARRATVVVDCSRVPERLAASEVFYPVLGSWLGLEVGRDVAVLSGLARVAPDEDRLKALGAAAASTGAVALFHVQGVTPEATDLDAAVGGFQDVRHITLTADMLRPALRGLSTVDATDAVDATGATGGAVATGATNAAVARPTPLDAVAVGSPHFSREEFRRLARLARSVRFRVPFYVCTSRAVLADVEAEGLLAGLVDAGVTVVADTCVVVTPILPEGGGLLMTSSGKFAHYAPANTGYDVVFGSLEDCVVSATSGTVARDPTVWSW